MDLIDALETVGIEYKDGKDDNEIWICCPFCSDDRFRFGVNIINGKAHCFNDGCEWSGRGEYTFSKLQEALDTGEIEAKQEKRKRKKKRMDEKIELPEGFELLQHPSHNDDHWNKKAWAFTRGRGVTKEQIRDKKIGFTVEGSMGYRVIFPVYLSGVLVGLVGRTFLNADPTYKNSVGSKCIYNLPEKKHSTAVLSEAVFTSLAIERVADKMGMDSLGLLGHSLKDDQVSLLRHYKRIVIWMDPDKPGVEGIVGKKFDSEGIYHKLKAEGKIISVVLPKGMLENDSFDMRDPDEMEHNEIYKRLERAEPLKDSLVLKLKTWMACGDE